MTLKQVKKLIQALERNKLQSHIARSVVDLRQPFFKENGKLLTVSEKIDA